MREGGRGSGDQPFVKSGWRLFVLVIKVNAINDKNTDDQSEVQWHTLYCYLGEKVETYREGRDQETRLECAWQVLR